MWPDNVKSEHIPLGQLDSFEDPRLVRIGNFEEGFSGKHHAEKILAPFIQSLKESRNNPKVAVLLMESDSVDKSTQTMLELIRAQVNKLSCEITVYHLAAIPETITRRKDLPFKMVRVESTTDFGDKDLIDAACQSVTDYICLFETSGMYHGHDIVNLVANISQDHLDAVWGSRRLSRKDMKASYHFRYKHDAVKGFISSLGSHALSLAYLVRHGRYISDTLSGLRLIKTAHVKNVVHYVNDPCFNQYLLCQLLRSGHKVFELPVEFLPISPEKVKRTTISDGIKSLAVILGARKQSKKIISVSLTTELKSIVFDMDGVLADTSPLHAKAYANLWTHIGIDGPEYSQIAGRSTKEVIEEQTRHLQPSNSELNHWINLKQTKALGYIQQSNTLYDEVPAVIEKLQHKQISFSMASSASYASASAILGQANLTTKFTSIITAQDVTVAKPSPESFILAMEKSKFDPLTTLIIEDSSSGIEAAIASGAWVVSVRSMLSINHRRFIQAYENISLVIKDLL